MGKRTNESRMIKGKDFSGWEVGKRLTEVVTLKWLLEGPYEFAWWRSLEKGIVGRWNSWQFYGAVLNTKAMACSGVGRSLVI